MPEIGAGAVLFSLRERGWSAYDSVPALLRLVLPARAGVVRGG